MLSSHLKSIENEKIGAADNKKSTAPIFTSIEM